MCERLIALIDMDCFYCQVETRLNPSLKGKPMAVVQYNQWKGGGIIAVNYEARDRGVTRHMRGEDAKRLCPEIELVSVPSVRGKADLTKYRDAGREVVKVLCQFSEIVQRASVDEAYIDLTESVKKRLALKVKVSQTHLENTFIVGYTSDDTNAEDERESGVAAWLEEVYSSELTDPELHKLATAGALVEEMRAAVYEKTGFRCSAGISHNKILAKLVCGIHKPNRQTILPMSSVPALYRTLPVKKVRNLGGKLGDDVVERLGICHMAELASFSEKQLQHHYDEKTANWLYNIARGIDHDSVTPQLIAKSIGCSKNFPGKNALRTRPNLTHWVSELAAEVAERLDEDLHTNKRKAQLLTVHFVQEIGGRDVSMSRSTPLLGYEAEKIAACTFNLLCKLNNASILSDLWEPPIKYLGISTSKFLDCAGSSLGSIDKFFKSAPSTSNCVSGAVPINTDDSSSELVSKKNDHSTTGKYNQTTDDNEPSVKSNNKGSFFERYFKDQPHKIIRRTIPLEKPIVDSNDLSDFVKTQITPENINTSVEPEIKINMNDKDKKGTSEENSQSHDESFISPSEIFPDLENIDDSVLNILPSPLQRKIANLKESKTKYNLETENSKTYSRESTDSDCVPTKIETVVDVHFSTEQQIASTSTRNVHQDINKEVEEDECVELIEEGLFDKTSLDIFELESDQILEKDKEDEMEKKVSVTNAICVKCKEWVPIYKYQEHLDHHVAMELHDQINKQVQPNRTAVSGELRTNKTVNVVSDKKKRGRPSKKDVIPTKKSRTILSFFTKT